jgi:hypothetical protein
MHAILKEEPGELPASVPPACDPHRAPLLANVRESRFQTAADLQFALESVSGASVRDSGTLARVPNRVSIVSLTFAFLVIFNSPKGMPVAAFQVKSQTGIQTYKRTRFLT